MKHTKLIGIFATILIAACAPVKPIAIKGPNGNDGFTMKCSGFGRTLEMCYQKAGEVCAKGYNLIDRSSSQITTSSGNGNFSSAPSHNLTIECK